MNKSFLVLFFKKEPLAFFAEPPTRKQALLFEKKEAKNF
jgi:hypothetical protein